MDSGESSECREGCARDATGNRIALDVDLNAPPPDVDLNNHPEEVDGQAVVDDADAEDDDVAIISPTMFAEARKSSRRSTNPATEVPPDRFNISFDLGPFSNSEDRNKTQDKLPPPAEPESNSEQQPPPAFTCGICIDKMVEETSTKCGHIFCKKCIETAIATQRKCPTCRQKLGKRDTIRVYLPKST